MTDLSAEELVRGAIQKLHRKIEALRPRHPRAEGEAMGDDPEITDPRDPYKRRDIVAELDRWLVSRASLREATVSHALLQAAREEIVALAASDDARQRRYCDAL